jgi:c-di-GMP-binding flagellar brake protein YcgR
VRQDAVYAFRAVVEQRSQLPIPRLELRPTGCAERIQRRQYFRVKVSMPVELIGNNVDASGLVAHLRSRTHDVSGSGISIRHPDPIPVGTVFETRLILPGELPPVKAVSKVVQSVLALSDRNVYHVGMHFLTIKEADRSRIIRVLFRIQQSAVS